ncbi:GntR family transcriptional regulator [Lysinibacillus alkalisoli]|uniref:GntR family transcriptional regulator n=1 Tax=Lysinibacillus alkalisoli TaxID=1911548 RepID=A0A917D3M7_9BACI|nr:GntR family transcriptional regulator [Lysinibacillus alkalisoli]GGG09778.1 GntR family transcriptional regulator [Lysinibacillus alkalisoli]
MANMKKTLPIRQPKYQKIAADIASKIVAGHYVVGEKIYARSSLASQYGVSAETARRAVAVLQDLDIVVATKGSGVMITSFEKAAQFVHSYEDVQSVQEMQNDLLNSLARQREELLAFEDTMTQLIERTERFRSINPFVPFQIAITNETPYIDESLQTMNFWQNTEATIVGIKSSDGLLLSPGPYATFKEGDMIYFIGNETCYERVKNFLYKN